MKKHKIEIMDENGHTELELETVQTLSKLKEEQKEGNWIYFDDKFIEQGTTITQDMLEKVDLITITPQMIGG